MSKLKSNCIQKIYKDKYLCEKGHSIIWKGTEYVYENNIPCKKCEKDGSVEHPIRWNCTKCNTFYCNLCFPIIMDNKCPIKVHNYKFYKQNLVDTFTYFTCDICCKKCENKNGLLFDKECNITICPKCFYDSCDVPEVLDD